jgi:molybdenum cofactor cytidylyltransferase
MNASILPRLRIIVLAAGFSTRLGRPKALARVHGVSLLRKTVALVAPLAAAETIVVIPPRSARYRAELRQLPVAIVANLQRASGLSSSVRRGIRRARYSAAVLLLPVDLVRLQQRDVARLIAVWRGARRRLVARRLPAGGGTPLVLPHWLYASALKVGGDQGLRELVRNLPQNVARLVDLASAEADVDTPRDLEHARRRLGAARF